jgi:hypothetical protein
LEATEARGIGSGASEDLEIEIAAVEVKVSTIFDR